MDKYEEEFLHHVTKAYEIVEEIEVEEHEYIDLHAMAKFHLTEAIRCMGLEMPDFSDED